MKSTTRPAEQARTPVCSPFGSPSSTPSTTPRASAWSEAREDRSEAEVTTLAAEAETSAGHLRRLCEERASSFSSRMDDLASSSSAGGSPAVGSRHGSPSGAASLPPIVGRGTPQGASVPPAPAALRGGPKRGGSGSYLLQQKGRPPSGGQRPALS